MGRTIIITGAGSGIGEATARRFWDGGWTVGLVGRRAGRLEAVAESAPSDDVAVVLSADISDEEAVDDLFARFVQQTGTLDVLFNNAGSSRRRRPSTR